STRATMSSAMPCSPNCSAQPGGALWLSASDRLTGVRAARRPATTQRERDRGRRPGSVPGVGREASVDRGIRRRFRDGDPDAVRLVYRAYGRLVYTVTHRVLRDAALAED